MMMKENDARALLGVSPNASIPEVKAAYKRKALESHPDRFPSDFKVAAESQFKQVTEAYQCLITGRRPISHHMGSSPTVTMARKGMRGHHIAASLPFVLLIASTLVLGGSCATRAYWRQQRDSPSHNPFLP